MNIIFSKAPLVEIVAELRWGQQPEQIIQPQQQGGMPVLVINSSKLDEFFMRFGGEVYQSGFNRAERLVPSNFPMMLHQPVYRYRKTSETDGSLLYQAGPGLFSANAIPPYRSWDDFSPVVSTGVDALLKTRDISERGQPFTSVSLRYIDAFGPNLTEGKDIESFMREVLGISVTLPQDVSKFVATDKKVKPQLQLFIPLSNNMSMNISIGEATVNNDLAFVMDTTVASSDEITPDVETVMKTFHSAHEVIHEMFFNLTTKIQPLMQPVEKAKV